jgi:hypothetical protein
MATAESTGTSCSMCGITVLERPMTWMLEADARGGPNWVCDGCARQNLRAIESKLDRSWW